MLLLQLNAETFLIFNFKEAIFRTVNFSLAECVREHNLIVLFLLLLTLQVNIGVWVVGSDLVDYPV